MHVVPLRRWSGLAVLALCALAALGCARRGSDDDRLTRLVTNHAHAQMRLDAYRAAEYGLEEGLDRFGDFPSPAYFSRARKLYTATRDALRDVDPKRLSEANRIEYRLLRDSVAVTLASLDFPLEALDFNQMGSRLRTYLDDANPKVSNFPFDTLTHYRAWLKRAEGFPAYVDAEIGVLKRGIAAGLVLNCTIAENTLRTYQDALEPDLAKNAFHQPLDALPASLTAQEKSDLTAAFEASIRDVLVPAVQRLDRFLREEYLPNCRRTYGLSGIPNGAAIYALSIRANTDLDLPPDRIHALGLAEVARITGEMNAVKDGMGFKGSLADFSRAKLQGEASYFRSSAEMFDAFRAYQAQVDAAMPRLFAYTPRAPLRIEESGNPEGSSATYNAPTDFQPAGRLTINAADLRSISRATLKSVYLHEAIPGHHYQLALQFELKDRLSEYRRKLFDSNAFAEGWALYAERLGREEGLVPDPIEMLGSLSEEMLRAVRLVVDTGIHHFGWSREQAVAYMMQNLPLDRRSVEIEADRYSVWPGQALGYKLGQLKFLELREKARRELGDAFDLREFHEVVIGQGMVSLGALEGLVDDWIARKRQSPPATRSTVPVT